MPKKTLIITDVTAMSADNVCIAGYDSSMTCIRPVLQIGQLKKRLLFRDGKLIIYPGAKVSFNLTSSIPQPPHIEDCIFQEAPMNVGVATLREWKDVLQQTSATTFTELFPSLESRYVPPGSAGPSIGTLRTRIKPSLSCEHFGNRSSLRMKIADNIGTIIERVPITDLAFRSLFKAALEQTKDDSENAVKFLNKKFNESEVYLRLGLTRPFPQAPAPYNGWCCLQINGIHTFPNLYDYDYDKWIVLE